MGFVEVYLSDEDKFKVLLLALGLFLLALLGSICLAASFCPLNKWLLERYARKRRQQFFHTQQQQIVTQSAAPVYLLNSARHCSPDTGKASSRNGLLFGAGARLKHQASNISYSGPPPAYEAALRATRLQSLTGAPPQLYPAEQAPEQKASQWPPQMVAYNGSVDRELDLGDYFHQPKEFSSLEPPLPHIQISLGADEQPTDAPESTAVELQPSQLIQRRAPVMLRLWVKMMEPGELVQRARGLNKAEHNHQTASRRLSRQLSIPQLFGSLVTLASGKQANPEASDNGERESPGQVTEMHSIISTSTNTSSSEDTPVQSRAPEVSSGDQVNELAVRAYEGDESMRTQSVETKQDRKRMTKRPQPRRRSSSFLAINSVTSRVLHMNVASFSYVRDEQLISTKKHNQLNYHHFFHSSASDSFKSGSKFCQLVISICDIENILNSCWLNEKSCALLAFSSAIYVQCEILLPKSKSARLLSYPLRALNQPTGPPSADRGAKTHTVNFSTTISAAALERQQPLMPPGMSRYECGPPAESVCSEPAIHHLHPSAADLPAGHQNWSSSADTSLNDGSIMSDSATTATDDQSGAPNKSSNNSSASSGSGSGSGSSSGTGSGSGSGCGSGPSASSTNWRHDPQADGRSIVIFNSVPKQIAHEQELAAASLQHQQETDLIQFDSVFVSPILSKSTIEDGFLRFTVYSQCKYVNETCLAELKLPLKQLLRSESRDNLGDANLAPRFTTDQVNEQQMQQPSNQQKQADFILNNLLENLVTANTGSPLSTLIEQISTEEREAEALEQQAESPDQPAQVSVFSRLHWLLTQQEQTRSSLSSAKKLKTSGSLNESLYRLGSLAASSIYPVSSSNQVDNQAQFPPAATYSDTQLYLGKPDLINQELADEDKDLSRRKLAEEQEAHERLMEQNYCRSLMVSHWLNYLVAPSYECQLSDDTKGKIILGLTYLPTSNRLIFNAHKASIDNDSYGCSGGKHLMKNLRLQSSTCYLLRFLMIVGGRVVKRKQTSVGRRPEWDSQEPITFDLASVSVAQPNFVVALVMRNATLHGSTGSLQNLQQRNPSRRCNCFNSASTGTGTGTGKSSADEFCGANKMAGAYSEPETKDRHRCCEDQAHRLMQPSLQGKRDLVIGHMVIGGDMWRELRTKPRKQIVRQFKLY